MGHEQLLLCFFVTQEIRLKVSFTISKAKKALRESRGIALLYFLTSALEGGEGSPSRPGRTLPPGKTRYPLYRRLGWPQSRSGQVRKISPPPGFDPWTVQPVELGLSRSTFFWVTPKALSYKGFTSHGMAHHSCAILTYSIPVAKS